MKTVYIIGGANGAGKTTLADGWFVFDNSTPIPSLVAERHTAGDEVVHNQGVWRKIRG